MKRAILYSRIGTGPRSITLTGAKHLITIVKIVNKFAKKLKALQGICALMSILHGTLALNKNLVRKTLMESTRSLARVFEDSALILTNIINILKLASILITRFPIILRRLDDIGET